MNERIKELFNQAGGKTSTRILASNPVQMVKTHELWGDHIEKFAELIVKEMIDECSKLCVEHAGWTPRMIAENIKERFGVES
jgi:hypothetical protein